MSKHSAGLIMVRIRAEVEVLLAHPGGPFWSKKDLGVWSLPKGQLEAGEEPLAAALREFGEETNFPATPPFHPLGEVRQKSGKLVSAWAFLGDADPAALKSNEISVEWPPRSGRPLMIPEIDRVEWMTIARAKTKILEAQMPFLDAVAAIWGGNQKT